MRLAWFTPWPPQPSGIAGRSAELVAALAARGHALDVFVDGRVVASASRASDDGPPAGQLRVQSAHDFLWRQHRGQYDLAVYQLGNSRLHDFIWPYLFNVPGLAVLHDSRLHHARGRTLLHPTHRQAYRAEFIFNHPATARDAAELAVHGFNGSYYYLWPMTRAVAAASRLVAAHTRTRTDENIGADIETRPVAYIPLGYSQPPDMSEEAREHARRALGIRPNAIVFGVFGGLSPEKRLGPILRAFARTRRDHDAATLLVAGAPSRDINLRHMAAALGITDAIIDLGVLDDDAFVRAISCVDVSVNLRWPSAVETSGPWIQALAAGRATIVIDHAHHAHVPALDPRDWRQHGAHGAEGPVTVAIDILDEEHSLHLAFDQLAADAALRSRLGAAGLRYWEAEHTLVRMISGYEHAFDEACRQPAPHDELPDALRPDPWRTARDLTGSFGVLTCELS